MTSEAHAQLESKLVEHFKENSCPIFQESELTAVWEELKNGPCDSSLSDTLTSLVDGGSLGVRTLSAGKDEVKVYWLKELNQHQETSRTTPSLTQSETLASVRRGGKRSQPLFVSPLIKEKRAKLDCSTGADNVKGRLDFSSYHQKQSQDGDDSDHKELQSLLREKRDLLTQLNKRKEKLRKLRMVKMYRTKNDLRGLDMLTQQWREVAQEAAQALLDSSTHQPRPSMQQLLDYLHIDPQIIHYSTEDESFY